MKQPKFKVLPSQPIDKKRAKVLSKLLDYQFKIKKYVFFDKQRLIRSMFHKDAGKIKITWNNYGE